MDYFKKVTVDGVGDVYVKDEEARSDLASLIDMLVSGTVTTTLLTEDGQELLAESGETLLATRHIG